MLLVFFQSTACVVMLTANHRSPSGDNLCCKTSCYHRRVSLAWANRKLDNMLRFVNLQLFREWECRHRHKDRELCADSDCCRHTDCVLSTVSGMTLDISMQTFAVIWQTVIYSSLPVFVVLCYIATWRYIWAGGRPAGLVTLMFILQCEQERRKWHVYTSIYCFSVWINVLIG